MRSQLIFSPMVIFTLVCLAVIVVGMNADVGRFITPETGLGYILGIVGGSLMLCTLVYPARKRIQSLEFLGSVKLWFHIHMVLGVLGPLLVLFHSNFRTGATNSNVALYCMLLVSGSGLVGRYIYSRVHLQMAGSHESLADLRNQISRLQLVSGRLAFVPDFSERISTLEAAMTAGLQSVPGLLQPPLVLVRSLRARLRMYSHLRRTAHAHALLKGIPVKNLHREMEAARELTRRHIDAVRRVTEYTTYERLFSLWHLLHLPLFFMLLVAGIVHVVAVHVY